MSINSHQFWVREFSQLQAPKAELETPPQDVETVSVEMQDCCSNCLLHLLLLLNLPERSLSLTSFMLCCILWDQSCQTDISWGELEEQFQDRQQLYTYLDGAHSATLALIHCKYMFLN